MDSEGTEQSTHSSQLFWFGHECDHFEQIDFYMCVLSLLFVLLSYNET